MKITITQFSSKTNFSLVMHAELLRLFSLFKPHPVSILSTTNGLKSVLHFFLSISCFFRMYFTIQKKKMCC